MGLNMNAISAVPHHRTEASKRLTESERAVATIKLMGLMILAVVCAVVVIVSPP